MAQTLRKSGKDFQLFDGIFYHYPYAFYQMMILQSHLASKDLFKFSQSMRKNSLTLGAGPIL